MTPSITSSHCSSLTLHLGTTGESMSSGKDSALEPGRDAVARIPLDATAGLTLSSPHRNGARRTVTNGIEHFCLHLSPSAFSITMGTGISAILLHNLPYNAEWLRRISIAIFVLNIVIFTILSVGNVVRYVRWRGVFGAVGHHLIAGTAWGALPMGLATIVNMIALVCVPQWGRKWALLALGLWWVDVLFSILCNFGMLFMMFARQRRTDETISLSLLLPIVTTVVAGASGGIIARALAPFDPLLARSTIICSFAIWGTGVPMAFMFITIWVYRTLICGAPSASALPTLFLPLGPCGQGSFGITLLGSVTRELAYQYDLGFAIAPINGMLSTTSMHSVADAVYAGCLVTGLVMWGLGLLWYTLATVMTIDHAIRDTSYIRPKNFSIGWTAYTFPIGTFATATTQLAIELDSTAFRVIGTFVSIQVVLQWFYVLVMWCWKLCEGSVLVSPELDQWEDQQPPLRWGSRRADRETV